MAQDYDHNPIHCATCGRELAPEASFCDNCGAGVEVVEVVESVEPAHAPGMPPPAAPGVPAPAAVPNYLTKSIIGTIFSLICCGIIGCIPGIVSIVFATQVDGKLSSGDYDGAVRSSSNANIWSTVAIVLGVVGAVIWMIVMILASSLGIVGSLL